MYKVSYLNLFQRQFELRKVLNLSTKRVQNMLTARIFSSFSKLVYVVLQLLPMYHDDLKVTHDDQINEDSSTVVNTRCTTTNVLSRARGGTRALFPLKTHIVRLKYGSA